MKSHLIRLTQITLSVALACALSACAGTGKKGARFAGADGDYVSGTPLPERQEGVSFMSDSVDKRRFSPVYFAFDSSEIGDSEKGKLDEVANFMRDSSSTVIIAGFTDERGTPEYNRGLGERRAQSVRQYLISLGASGGKLQTVSFGAEMPADPASNESAWARNRRAEFGVVR
jgi:peptidoglycan-associated lipoprotein